MTVNKRQSFLLVKRISTKQRNCMTLDEVARACGLHPEVLDRFYAWGLIEPARAETEEAVLFMPDVVRRVKKIVRLRRDLNLNLPAVGLVMELLDRIDSLESRLRELQNLQHPQQVE